MIGLTRATPAVALVAALIAGCGGGGGSDTAVSSTPPAPAAPVAATPTPAPDPNPTVPGPSVVPGPAAPTPASPTPPPTPVPNPPTEAQSVAFHEFDRAWNTGIPLAANPPVNWPGSPGAAYWWSHENSRRAYATSGAAMRLNAGPDFWRVGEPVQHENLPYPTVARYAHVQPEIAGQTIYSVIANSLVLTGPPAQWTSQTVQLNAPLGEWRSDEWFARLIPTSEPGRLDQFRICWHVRLPTEAFTGLDGSVVLPATVVERMACGIYRIADGVNVGAFVDDDVAGQVTSYRGAW